MDVHKSYFLVNRKGVSKTHIAVGDLIFINDAPHAVFEWVTGADGVEKPGSVVELDPDHLSKIQGDSKADYSYSFPITDPRQLS